MTPTDLAGKRIKAQELRSTNPLHIPHSITMNSRQQILSRTDRQSFQVYRHPAFVQAVNRAANLKCLEAIKSGKLRVVAPHPSSSTTTEYTPRYVIIYIIPFLQFPDHYFLALISLTTPQSRHSPSCSKSPV